MSPALAHELADVAEGTTLPHLPYTCEPSRRSCCSITSTRTGSLKTTKIGARLRVRHTSAPVAHDFRESGTATHGCLRRVDACLGRWFLLKMNAGPELHILPRGMGDGTHECSWRG